MITTDFSGSYDYEKEEAEAIAVPMFEDLQSGYYTLEQFAAACQKEAAHWQRVLGGKDSESYQDFARHFNAAIKETQISI